MSDDALKLVASVEDKFTGPLAKLKKGISDVASATKENVAAFEKDWTAASKGVSKFEGVLKGVTPVLSGLGVSGIGVALSLGGMAAALGGFSSKTRDLSLMAKDIGLTIDQLRTFSALGERFGVTADTMAGAAKSFAGQMFEIKRHGEAYVQLQAMNLSKLAEDLASSKTMQEAIERGMEGLRNIPDAEVRRRVSRMLFGTDDIGLVASNLTGPVSDAMKKVSESVGKMSKETEQAAKDFQTHMSRISEAAERAKLKFIGPLLKGMVETIDGVEAENADPQGQELARTKKHRAETQERLKKAYPWMKPLYENQIASDDAKIKRLEDRIREGTKKGVGDALKENQQQNGGLSASPSSFNGPAGGGSMIQKAAWGGDGFGGGFGGGSGFGGGGGGASGGGGLTGGNSGVGVSPAPYHGPLSPHGEGGGTPSAPFMSPPVGGGHGGGGGGDDAVINGKRYRYGGFTRDGRARINSWLGFFQKPVDQGGLGMDLAGARAMVAMMQGESGENLNPEAKGDYKDPRHKIGPTAFGTAQWRLERFEALKQIGKEMGLPWTDVRVQQQHMRREMLYGSKRHREAYRHIMTAQTEDEKLGIGIAEYERPAQPGLAHRFRRVHLTRLHKYGLDGHEGAAAGGEKAPPARLPSDAMLRRRRDPGATVAQAGRGTLHIKVDGPAGTKVRHDMADLFNDVRVSHARSQMDMDTA